MRKQAGFTLVELLVVIGIIAVLIGILLPSLAKAREQAKVAACMSNVRQLTSAWIMYANENKGFLVWAETSGIDPATPGSRDGWVVDIAGKPESNTPAAIKQGLLWKFAPNPEVYRCPSSYDSSNYRSYSINTLMNGAPALGIVPITKIAKAKPQRIVFIEEFDERGFNQGSYLQYSTPPFPQYLWGDIPAFFHRKGTVISLADGHAEYRIWSDQRTLKAKRDIVQANNSDLKQLKFDLLGQ